MRWRFFCALPKGISLLDVAMGDYDDDRRNDDDRIAARAARNELSTARRLFPTPGPKMYGFGVWWIFGLYVLFYASAPYVPTDEEQAKFDSLMAQAQFSEEMREAHMAAVAAQRHLDEVHVFGWRWRSPYDKLVPPRQRALDAAQAELRLRVQERDAIESEAKAQVGLWSAYGIEQVRATWWKAYQSGKDFAKRMTFWDVMFGVGGGRRDEELLVTMARWLGQIMMNFTVGLISALFSFMFSLVGMIWEYKASYLSGLLFFFVAMSGASAMVATFVGGMYATAAGGIYMAIQGGARHARLEGGRQRAQQRMRYQQSGGYEYAQRGYADGRRYQHYD